MLGNSELKKKKQQNTAWRDGEKCVYSNTWDSHF